MNAVPGRLRRVAGAGLALAIAALLSAPAAALAEEPDESAYRACRVSAEVSPRVSFVGQQLRYVARIVRNAQVTRVEWVRPPSFPDFRAERMPGHAEETEMTYRGVTYMAREEHRAIHPLRAGRFTIPAARLRCTTLLKGQSQPVYEEAATEPLEIEVRPLPEAGRPEHFAGLVGRARLQVVIEPRRVVLGETVSVSVGVLGAANVWVLPDLEAIVPLSSLGDRVDVFDQPSSLDLSAGDELVARRFLRAELVPRHPGPLVVPGARLAIFDPQLARYEIHETEPITIEVAPRQTGRPAGVDPSPSDDGEADAAAPTPGRSAARWLGFVGCVVVALLLWPLARGLRRWQAWRPVREALAEANGAVMRADPADEAAALERALRRAVGLHASELARAAPEEILRAASSRTELATVADALREAAAQLEALGAVRFSDDAAPCDRSAVDAALAMLRTRGLRRREVARRLRLVSLE